MPEKKLNLLQFAARGAAEPSATSAEIVRREFANANLGGELLDAGTGCIAGRFSEALAHGPGRCLRSVRAGRTLWQRGRAFGEPTLEAYHTEVRAGAKSVFHFDVQGSAAKSTHAGLPWLRHLRRRIPGRVHFWPFDGWVVPVGRTAVAEVYPSPWRSGFPRADRDGDQHDAYSAAAWLRRADGDGTLPSFLEPGLTNDDRQTAEVEG